MEKPRGREPNLVLHQNSNLEWTHFVKMSVEFCHNFLYRCAFLMNCFANLNSFARTLPLALDRSQADESLSLVTDFKFYNYFVNFWFFFSTINYNWVCLHFATLPHFSPREKKPYSNQQWWAWTSNKQRDLPRDKRWTDWMSAIHRSKTIHSIWIRSSFQLLFLLCGQKVARMSLISRRHGRIRKIPRPMVQRIVHSKW